MLKRMGLCVMVIQSLLCVTLFAGNSAVFKVTATVPVIQSIAVTDVQLPTSLSGIVPTGNFSEDINAVCWNVVAPIKIQLSVTNNTVTRKLVIFTNHRDTTRLGNYWPSRLASLPLTATINGLINTTYYTEATWYANTAPLRAFLDYNNEGLPTTNNNEWVWVNDVSAITSITDYLSPQTIGVLYDGNIRKNNVDVYVKTAWDKTKEGGDYQGKLVFGIVSQ